MKTRTHLIVLLSLVLVLTLPSVSKLTATCSAACERMDDACSSLSCTVVVNSSALTQKSAAPSGSDSVPAVLADAAIPLSAAGPESGRSSCSGAAVTQESAIADGIPLSAPRCSADAGTPETLRQRSRMAGAKRMLPPAGRIALIF